MNGLRRCLVVLGAISAIAVIDGVIAGLAAAQWGDAWGNRLDDLALFAVAIWSLWQWAGKV